MTTTTDIGHDDHNAYLWDRSAPVDADAAAIERALGEFTFTPEAQPARLGKTDTRYRFSTGLLLAASLLLASGAGFYFWRLSWPAGQSWTITRGAEPTLAVGATLQTHASEQAQIDIARIGTMKVGESTSLSLTTTTSTRHRLEMTRGTIDVRVWAPPARFAIHTPAGDVIDLGCVFRLEVEDAGTVKLRVETGWVQLANAFGESLIPAGASSSMAAGQRPLVPLYDDAAAPFAVAVRGWENTGDLAARAEFASAVTTHARPRDVFTLLMLAVRASGRDRAAFITRAAELAPPPSTVSAEKVAAGDDEGLWVWRGALPLPPPKSWWRNWADVLPR
jgi:hypothetical protein